METQNVSHQPVARPPEANPSTLHAEAVRSAAAKLRWALAEDGERSPVTHSARRRLRRAVRRFYENRRP